MEVDFSVYFGNYIYDELRNDFLGLVTCGIHLISSEILKNFVDFNFASVNSKFTFAVPYNVIVVIFLKIYRKKCVLLFFDCILIYYKMENNIYNEMYVYNEIITMKRKQIKFICRKIIGNG